MNQPHFFISYSHKDSIKADEIDGVLSPLGIVPMRDIRDLEDGQNIKKFMKKIRDIDYILLLISENFLKSESCMFEILELMKDENYENRVIPIILENKFVNTNDGILEIITYWVNKHDELNEKLKSINDFNATKEILFHLSHLNNIKNEIGTFLTFVKNRANKTGFKDGKFDYVALLKYTNLLSVLNGTLIEEIQNIIDQKKSFEEVELDLLTLLNDNNSNLVYFFLGLNAGNAKNPKKASVYYKKIIDSSKTKSNDLLSNVYNNYGKIFDESNKDKEAEQYYLLAIELSKKNYRARTNLASLWAERYPHKKNESKKLFEESLEINPGFEDTHANYANLLVDHFHNKDLAKIHYEFALILNPDSIYTLNNYATNILKESNCDLAIAYLKKAISLDSSYFEAKYNLGTVYGYWKQHKEAIDVFNDALMYAFNEKVKSSTLMMLGNTYLILNEAADAKKCLEEAINADPENLMAKKILELLTTTESHKE